MRTIIHKSPALLAFKIILLELLLEMMYFVVSTAVQLVGQMLGYELQLVSPITQLSLLPVQLGILIWLLATWMNETYEVKKDEIITRYGLIRRIQKAYPYYNMQTVVVQQSLLERMFGAGTVSVFVPTLGTDIIFTEVPNPNAFAEIIKEAIPRPSNSQFVLRK